MNNERKANPDDGRYTEDDDKREGRWMDKERRRRKRKARNVGEFLFINSAAELSRSNTFNQYIQFNTLPYMTQYEPSGIRGGRGGQKGRKGGLDGR